MAMTLEELLEAVRGFHANRQHSLEDAIDGLEQVSAEADTLADALRDDLRREQGG